VLARDGYPGLSARANAAEARTNLALLNYYFGSKEQLLLQIFDLLDTRRLARQRAMYAAPEKLLSARWRRAVAFYQQDLADGYVRILQELTALGYSSARVARRVRDTRNQWRLLLEEVAASALPALGITIPPARVATAVSAFWLGMETQHLVGAAEEDSHYFEQLEAIGDWLEQRERAAGLHGPAEQLTDGAFTAGSDAEGGPPCERNIQT
jgi:AcrR family transcriptional regulator